MFLNKIILFLQVAIYKADAANARSEYLKNRKELKKKHKEVAESNQV